MKGVVSFPSTKWDRQGLRQRSSPPCYLPTPFPGVGGERSETEGGGWMGHSAARVQRVAVAASPQVFYNAAFGGPLHHFVVPLPRRAVGGKFEGRGLLSPTKWDRQGLRATFFSSMLPAHPLPGGGWRAQRDGRGRLDGPLRGPGSEGGGGGFTASFL